MPDAPDSNAVDAELTQNSEGFQALAALKIERVKLAVKTNCDAGASNNETFRQSNRTRASYVDSFPCCTVSDLCWLVVVWASIVVVDVQVTTVVRNA